MALVQDQDVTGFEESQLEDKDVDDLKACLLAEDVVSAWAPKGTR